MLSRLSARDFRNLRPLTWRPGAGGHLLVGGNGAGKTSLLEAIYVLATTRSFRAAQLADCRRHGAEFFHLEGEADGAAPATLTVGWSDGGKTRAVNSRTGPLSEHLAALAVVAWTAADAELLTGAPVLRRRFLDRGIVGLRPAALSALSRYRRALAAKRQLLAAGGGPGIDAWNGVLAAAAAEVIALRSAYADRLAAALAAVLATSGLPWPPIALSYRPSPAAGLAGREAIERSLAALRRRELAGRRPLAGPHRDELEVRWAGHELRRVASAGERKALGLLLMAAHGRVLEAAGRRPVYLLDDADAELAPTTLAGVWRCFCDAGQLFASSNRPAVWEGLEVRRRWALAGGEISPCEDPERGP